MTRWTRAAALGVGGLTVAAAGVTIATYGAFRVSPAERRRPMPGDSIIPAPMYSATQSVTIDAPPERVWPWLAQMGADRGGWYSYDRVDNGGRPSATAIRPEFQDVAPGDVFPALPGATDAFVVAEVRPSYELVLAGPVTGSDRRASWAFRLEPLEHGRTRLLVRGRVSSRWLDGAGRDPAASERPIVIERIYGVLARLPRPLLLAVASFGHRVMQNRQLRGIRRRAEAG